MPAIAERKVAPLSPRQRQVVRLTSLGCSVPEMAAILRLAPSSVDNQRQRAMQRLGVSRAPLVSRMAIKQGISPVGDALTPSEKRRRPKAGIVIRLKRPPMQVEVAALTPRLRQVVRLVSLGCTMEEIAAILDVHPTTADNHRIRAMRALGTNKATLVTRIAIEYGISPLNDRLSRREQRLSGRKRDGWN